MQYNFKILTILLIVSVNMCKSEESINSDAGSEESVQITHTVSSDDQPMRIYEAEKLPDWLLQSSMNNAPTILKGILNYLKSYSHITRIHSFHRLMLIGKPGTGKTTLAQVFGSLLGYKNIYVPISEILGNTRNHAAVNIRNFFHAMVKDPEKKVLILDELNKLFEHCENEHYDDAATATAFWLGLDLLERYSHVIVIGTANDAKKIPDQIKSRFHGKIISISMPSIAYKLEAFVNIIKIDRSIVLDQSVNKEFIIKLISRWPDCSLRDIQLLLDTAKIYSCARNQNSSNTFIYLYADDFNQALKKLQDETKELREDILTRMHPIIKKLGNAMYLLNNSIGLVSMAYIAMKNLLPTQQPEAQGN